MMLFFIITTLFCSGTGGCWLFFTVIFFVFLNDWKKICIVKDLEVGLISVYF